MDKEDLGKYLGMNTLSAILKLLFYLIKWKLKLCVSTFLYCTSRHYLSKRSLKLMFVSAFTSWNSGSKSTYSAQVRLYCFTQKKNKKKSV